MECFHKVKNAMMGNLDIIYINIYIKLAVVMI